MSTLRKFQSRKFALAAFLLVIALPLLLWHGRLDAAVFADLVKWVFGIYATGNLAEHAAAKFNAQPGDTP